MTIRTKSGIFVREDYALGLITYNPFSGLFYACAYKDKEVLIKWLNKEILRPPSPIYSRTLGVGWLIKASEAAYPQPNLLPQVSDWVIVPPCYQPILVNWLITGNCPLNCRYCYAQDTMHGKYTEPNNLREIQEIANNIIKIDPLVVVLTGGDPLVSPYLEDIIKLLYGRVGIILDTSAYSLTQKHIKIFKKYDVFVRISLDSEIPRINNYLRPVSSKASITNNESRHSLEAALDAIVACTENGLKVAVQSVATKKNLSDFEALGNKLFKLGVSGWRILMVAPSKNNLKEYDELRGDKTAQRRFHNYIEKKVKSKQQNSWYDRMSIQIISNEIANAVLLVAPDGTFLTETNLNKPEFGKIPVDSISPKKPRIESIRAYIDMNAHTARYLNFEKW